MQVKFGVDVTMSSKATDNFARAATLREKPSGLSSPEEVAKKALASYIQDTVKAYLQERGAISVIVIEKS